MDYMLLQTNGYSGGSDFSTGVASA